MRIDGDIKGCDNALAAATEESRYCLPKKMFVGSRVDGFAEHGMTNNNGNWSRGVMLVLEGTKRRKCIAKVFVCCHHKRLE